MPKYTLDQLPLWARGLLEEYTAGELQAGVRYSIPKKAREEIISTTEKAKGTRIPAPTLQKFMDGVWRMSDRTLNKLRTMRDRVNYMDLRAAGLKPKQARKLYRKRDAAQKAAKMRQHAQTLAQAKNTKLQNVLWGMHHAKELATITQWDLYMRKKFDGEPEEPPAKITTKKTTKKKATKKKATKRKSTKKRRVKTRPLKKATKTRTTKKRKRR